MIAPRTSRRERPYRLAGWAGSIAALASVLLAACGGAGGSARRPASALAPALPTPLATSVRTAAGTWATLPMGHLDQPLNTFWQLLYRPAGGGPWSNQVEATAEATNGGLVLASPQNQGLLVGIRPSYLLEFSPLLETADAGRSWSTGLVPAGLAASPGALAAASPGQALALVSAHGGAQVLASTAGINSWRTLTSQAALAATPAGRRCGLGAVTAVSYFEGEPLVAGSCASPGVVGMFAERAGVWRLLPVSLAGPLDRARAEVLGLQSEAGELRALVGLSTGSQSELLAVWWAGGRWGGSQPLSVPAGAALTSLAPAAANGIFALLTGGGHPPQLALASRPGAPWQALPAPPAGIATVAAGAAGSVEALAVSHGNVLTVWSLPPGSHAWARRQTLDVQILYGSSE